MKGTISLRNTLVVTIVSTTLGVLLTIFLPKLYEYSTRDKREFIKKTPTELINWYAKIDNEVQANQLAETFYYKKYFKYNGTIKEISDFPYGKITLKVDSVIATFKKDNRITSFNKGETIYFTGQLTQIFERSILLDNCELSGK